MDPLALKVAARFAGKRPMKPEKLKELMLKLRKGAGTGLKMGALMPVFEALGGWSFDEMFYPKPEIDYRPDNRGYFTHSHRNVVEEEWQSAKDREVSNLPSSTSLGPSDLHKKVYMDVEPIQEALNGQVFFHFKVWQVSKGVRVKAPNGATFEAAHSPEEFENEYQSLVRSAVKGVKFPEWLKTQTPYFKQMNDFLGLDSVEHEKDQKRLEQQRKHREGGNATCPVCFGMFKLVPKTKKGKDKTMPGMILHGYKRPGTGWIEGNCFGQDWPPFELSPEGTQAWLVRMEKFEKGQRKHFEYLRSGNVTELSAGDAKIKDGKFVPSTIFRKSEMDPREWDKMFQKVLQDAEDDLRRIEFECDRLRKLIAAWKPEPLGP
jgi:hypothetical protein